MENKEWLNYQQLNANDVDTNGFQELKIPSGVLNVTLPIGIRKGVQKTYLPEHNYICGYCGKEFHRRGLKTKRAKYCSLSCKYNADKLKEHKSTKVKTGQTFVCKTCGKQFYRHPSEIAKRKSNYCSLDCRLKGKYNPYKKGELCTNWKGGRMYLQGYIYIKSYNHPNKNSSEYVAEHRLVMEKYLGRYLLPNEDVHHRNGIKTDNSIDNLELVVHNHHFGHITCPYCNNTFKVK